MSHVKVTSDSPEYVANLDGIGTLRILEAVRILDLEKKKRIYQASTSELYRGMLENKNEKGFYDENSHFYPRSPYGAANINGFWITKNYREAYNMFACNDILFNLESPKRGKTFVTRKITRAVSKIALGMQKELYMGNLDAKRDWGHAKDYVKAMWLILQQDVAEDFVMSTGVTTKVRDFIQMAFAHVGFKIRFEGQGVNEVGILDSVDQVIYEKATGSMFNNLTINIGDSLLKVDLIYFRPTEVDLLLGDPTKSKIKLGWTPEYDLQGLIKDMMVSDLNLFQRDLDLVKAGHHVFNQGEY